MSLFRLDAWPERRRAATVAAAFGLALFAGELLAFRDAYYSQSLGITYLETLPRSGSWKWLVSQGVKLSHKSESGLKHR